MTGRKKWMAAMIAEAKKDLPALPFTRQARAAKPGAARIVVKKSAA
ncbi:hypothetical protein [Shimia ponticola]|nr:hypothetical protein [Shimia ponticola]